MMTTYIYLRQVRMHACHGVLPQEGEVGGNYIVNLKLGYDITKAMASDDVADTLNYAELYAALKEEMAQPSALLEHVGGRIVKRILQKWPQVTEINLDLMKENPPMGADCDGAGIQIHLINNKTTK